MLLLRTVAMRSAAAHMLGMRVLIPPGAWKSVSFDQIGISATGWTLVQRSPTQCGVSECDGEDSIVMP
jgi:hypothetical protein